MTYEGFTEFWIGFYFTTDAFVYIANSFCIASYCKWFGREKVQLSVGAAKRTVNEEVSSPVIEVEAD